jgi:endonuclease YncB( thermonuclease family)
MIDSGLVRTGRLDSNRPRSAATRVLTLFAAVAALSVEQFAILQGSAAAPKPAPRPAAPPRPQVAPPARMPVPTPSRAGQRGPQNGPQHSPGGSGNHAGIARGPGKFVTMPKAQSHLQNSQLVRRHHWHAGHWHRGWFPWLPYHVAGTVTNVQSGDTITVLTALGQQQRMRLFGTAAPLPSQPFGPQSQQHLAALVLGKVVHVRTLGTDLNTGDPVAMVFFAGNYVNRQQISAGMAWNYVDHGMSPDLADAESEAIAAGAGLWSLEYAEAPWLASVANP